MIVAHVEAAPGVGLTYTGVVGARVESSLGFRVQGKIVARLVDTGQLVRRGQPLMRLDPTDYGHAAIAQSENVAAARARWVQASADERRNRGLAATGAISASRYDDVKAASDSAKAALDAAIAQQSVAQDQHGYAVLLADDDGTVMQTLAEPGQVVAAGQAVLWLAHAGPREAVVNLPEAVRPMIGSEARVLLYAGGPAATARLRQLSDSADPRTRTFEARYVMSGDDADAPLGATVSVTLTQPGAGKDQSVPLGAIDDEGSGPGVWVINAVDSTVAFRPVRVVSIGEDTAEIQGLQVGQAVVAAGGHELRGGEKVRPMTVRAAMQ
ncbi:efflux RND transporter periplasmic adaptor subunit [Acetobacteraceae bacterium KSS8]|uniref:Efflux RND transporter periplasmic adaptor subunit n=1 Tax=Endosaccharibacter trunci TaxID=2812733 RepID=A0ABT1W663_9PROT|nr:efflux RND transporter periplasmic adaptor subunit [Acetobacteraceae bacterium KSS8]